MTLFQKAAAVFLALWIFSIPFSLSIHFHKEQGLVNGFLVDYRIPQIQLSAILLGLAAISLTLAALHAKNVQWKFFGKVGTCALLAAFIFQIAVGLFQFQTQHSLTGYLPFGEVSYQAPQIAKGVFFGRIYKLPYGTMVHPNVFAGFLVLSLLIFAYQPFIEIPRRYGILLTLLVVTMCVLTQSLAAFLALIFAGLILATIRFNLSILARTLIIFVPLASFVFFCNTSVIHSSHTSLSRRGQLQQIAVQMIKANPVLGVGWNNFTLQQEKYGIVSGSLRFLQPVHNSFVLLITELGLAGWLVTVCAALAVAKINAHWLPPLGALIFISSLDHYPLTITTGRMIIILLLIALYFAHRRQLKAVII